MARIIPNIIDYDEFNNSVGERRIYEALKTLPDDYIVFYSVDWQREYNTSIIFGESDFTIFNPNRGMLVIEVKSGGIRHDNIGWYQINSNTKEEIKLKRDPLVQANRSKYTFLELFDDKLENHLKFMVESAVWFPSISDKSLLNTLPPNYAPDIVLTEKDLCTLIESIEKIFDYYKMPEKKDISFEISEKVIEILSPTFRVVPSLKTSINEEEYIFNRLTSEQSYLLDYLEEQNVAVIQGGAGTGKTMLAIEKAKRASATGKILFLCFHKMLLESLKRLIDKEKYDVDVYNLPALFYNQTGLLDSCDNEKITDFLNSINLKEWEYKHIIVDEGQDFSEDHLKLLAKLAELKDGCFYVFYDKNQLVQQKHYLEWLKSIDCRLVLTANCRNTKSIAVTSNKVIKNDKIKMKLEINGKKPNFYFKKMTQEARDCIFEIINNYINQGLSPNNVVILTTKTESSSCFTGINSIGPYKITNTLPKNNEILFTSARKFKGLEADIVILIDVDNKNFDSAEDRRLFYVGASRAKHYLDIVCNVNETQLKSIAESLEGRKAIFPGSSIAKGLQVVFKK